MVLETVAIETLATAATVRMSGVFAADFRVDLRATNASYSKQTKCECNVIAVERIFGEVFRIGEKAEDCSCSFPSGGASRVRR
jgi:hypothetical protein